MPQGNKIKIRRGANASLPAGGTEAGELRYSTDTKEIYIDDGANNVKIGGDPAGLPVSTAQQTALDLKANLADPTFTGTVAGITKTMVGLGSVDNTSDVNKPVSTAQQNALDGKLSLTGGTMTLATLFSLPTTAYSSLQSKVVSDAQYRFVANVTGKLSWGDGSGATDTNLYRSAVDTLKTDDTFNAVAGVQINGTSVLDRSTHTGTQSADTLTDGTTNKAFLATERTKLTGIASGATANSTDAVLLARANHTGTQLAATVSDFSTAADARITAQKGAASGLAPLDSSSKIASTYLPAIAITSTSTVANQAAQLALTAQEGDVAIRTDLNQTYIQNGGSAGTMADWTLLATPTDAVSSVAGRTGVVVLAKADVGLGSVDNTADSAKPVSTAQAAADALALQLTGGTMTSYIQFSLATGTTFSYLSQVTGDTVNRFAVNASGKMFWGPGGAATDTTLYRSTTNTLKTDNTFQATRIGAGITPSTSIPIAASAAVDGVAIYAENTLAGGNTTWGNFHARSITATSRAISTDVTNDAVNRFRLRVDGQMSWGDGVLAEDTNLYRSAADTLKTDDTFNAVGGLQVNGSAVAILASPTFTGTPAAPTATAGTNTTQLATTAFVTTAVSGGGGGNAYATDVALLMGAV
jgi:hypothetical protein